MHIPKGTTAELELVTFRQALAAANTPTDAYDITEIEKWLKGIDTTKIIKALDDAGLPITDLLMAFM